MNESSAALKWGLIGYGDLARKRVAAALQNASGSLLCGVWGRDWAKTGDFAARHGIQQAHSSLESLLHSEVEAIYVCTPPDSHLEYALAAFEAGKHVLVEKPMANSADECRAMMAAAREANRTLGVAYYRRTFPKMRHVRQLIEDGVLGEVTWVNIASHSWYAPPPADDKHWRVQKARSGGGGAVADIGVHRLDLLDYWLGPSRVLFKNRQRLVHRQEDYEVEDGTSAVLQLENGAPVHAYFAWNSKTGLDRFEIVGSEGKILIDPLDGPSLVVMRGGEREELAMAPPENLHLYCVEDFVEAVATGRNPICDGEAGLRTAQLLEEIVS